MNGPSGEVHYETATGRKGSTQVSERGGPAGRKPRWDDEVDAGRGTPEARTPGLEIAWKAEVKCWIEPHGPMARRDSGRWSEPGTFDFVMARNGFLADGMTAAFAVRHTTMLRQVASNARRFMSTAVLPFPRGDQAETLLRARFQAAVAPRS